jgi:hypothetical protein
MGSGMGSGIESSMGGGTGSGTGSGMGSGGPSEESSHTVRVIVDTVLWLGFVCVAAAPAALEVVTTLIDIFLEGRPDAAGCEAFAVAGMRVLGAYVALVGKPDAVRIATDTLFHHPGSTEVQRAGLDVLLAAVRAVSVHRGGLGPLPILSPRLTSPFPPSLHPTHLSWRVCVCEGLVVEG